MGDMCEDKQVVYRLGKVEGKVESVDKTVTKIMTNHLPHVEQELIHLGTTVKIYGRIIMGALLGLIAGVIGLIFS